MRLVSFSVENYRSITTARELSFGDCTVLVGRNNEGKTNLLRALDMSLRMLSDWDRAFRPWSRRYQDVVYRWDRDFPMQMQADVLANEADGESRFVLVFSVEEEDVNHFVRRLQADARGLIAVELTMGLTQRQLRIVCDGHEVSDDDDLDAWRYFIGSCISPIYIPAVRTNRTALSPIEDTIRQRLRVLERNREYIEAVEKIDELQQRELTLISEQLARSLKVFMQNVQSVEVTLNGRGFSPLADRPGSYEVAVDDGVKTAIEQKGDGVQSLAAIAMLSDSRHDGGSTILIVEEPESHLHPGAMRELLRVLETISGNGSQVIISTHNSLFVRRDNVSSNIIVEHGSARPAQSINEVREVLGVSVADNLIHAKKVLVVEGKCDEVILRRLLPMVEQKLEGMLSGGEIAVRGIGGTHNLCYELTHLRNELCSYIVLVDHDKAGTDAVERAKEQRLFDSVERQVVTASRDEHQESEVEDFIKPEVYVDSLARDYAIPFDTSDMGRGNLGILNGRDKKWSDKIRQICAMCGCPCDDELLAEMKTKVSKLVAAHQGPLDEIVTEDARFLHRLATLLLDE